MHRTTREPSGRFVLLVGSTATETVVSKLKTSRMAYVEKRLESSPENWSRIVELVRSPDLVAAVLKFTGKNLQVATRSRHHDVAVQLVAALATVRHLVLFHESLLEPAPPKRPEPWHNDSPFTRPSDEALTQVFGLLDEHRINFVPYRTNAELSVMSAAFVEDNAQNLLFRVYVPAGRLYADEADKLILLFHDWLTRVKGHRVRRDGYETAQGQVFEFFGDGDITHDELVVQFSAFSRFLDLSVTDVSAAAQQLVGLGIDLANADRLVTRYAKEFRRLERDLRQARDQLLVRLRYELEEELDDDGVDQPPTARELDQLLRRLVPEPMTAQIALDPETPNPPRSHVNINVTNQIIKRVEGSAVASVHGTIHFGADVRELLHLIEQFGSHTERGALKTAAYELEDPGAPHDKRLLARQRLKKFLAGLGGKVEDTALKVLQSYVESKIGV